MRELPDSMSAEEYRALIEREHGLTVPGGEQTPKRNRKPKPPTSMTEAELMDAIVEAADRFGYLCWHDNQSVRNRGGFPDLHIVGHGHQFVMELKSDRGESRPDQRAWIREYQGADVVARFVYPEDLDGVLAQLEQGAR